MCTDGHAQTEMQTKNVCKDIHGAGEYVWPNAISWQFLVNVLIGATINTLANNWKQNKWALVDGTHGTEIQKVTQSELESEQWIFIAMRLNKQ